MRPFFGAPARRQGGDPGRPSGNFRDRKRSKGIVPLRQEIEVAAQEDMVPVTILTGFLGSGKTTLLNRILKEQHGHRIAVIENEFGEAGVDNDILLNDAKEQIVEMNNGCVCCTVRGDLIRILGELRERRESGKLAFERVIIETTGMADPGPVAQTFFVDEGIGNYYLLDSVITLVDAKHAPRQLDEFREAQEQVGFADRILMSKSDLVSEGEQEKLRKRLVKMNPRAPIGKVHFGNTPIAEILDIRGFNLNAVLELDPEFLEESEHEHDEHVGSFVFRSGKAFDPAKLEEFLSGVVQIYGPDMLRYKGVLYMKGNTHRVVFQGVHMMMGGDLGRAWEKGEKRSSTMVFIGKNLPQDLFIKGLEQCLVEAQ
jgi:G3E family GTPase